MSQVFLPARRWFSVARILILAHTLVGVIITVWNMPNAYQNLRNFVPNLGFQEWNAEQLHSAVKASGIAPDLLAIPLFLVSLFCLASFWGVAALLAWRKSDSWIGLLIIYILAMTAPGFSFLGSNVGAGATGFFPIYQKINVALGFSTFFVLLYLFPDGRFIPRWTRFLAPLPFLAFLLAFLTDPQGKILSSTSIILTLLQWFAIFYAVGGIASQVYRYRRGSSPAQRQQTKWVVYALGILVASLVITQAVLLIDSGLSIGTLSRFWFDLLGNYLFGVVVAALIPLSIGISILRYRLWDIDLIIRRTLLYALLSGLLGLVYFGSVVLLRQVLGGLTGNSSAALVLSTLLIAVLFSPLRRRLQEAVDRRFYRPKYDAVHALDEFADAACREVSLDALTAHLSRVVNATMQPQSFGLWLKLTKYTEDRQDNRSISRKISTY